MSGLSQRDLKLIISLLSNKAALVIIAALILLSMCSENNESSTPTTNLAPKTLTTPQEIRIERYVNTGKLNKRNSPNGEIIGSITRGNKVEIYETNGSWVRVSAENYPPEWISNEFLCSGTNCHKKSETSVAEPSNSGGDYQKPHCACGRGNYCIGPRGGHFCITSGGKKRYLPRD